MNSFEKVIRLIIKQSGGSVDKVNVSDYMERFSHSFAFAPNNYWLGVTIMKNPLDLAVLQQIMFDNRPDTIIECGTAYGGSAYFLACMMDVMHIKGKIITIDHEPNQIAQYRKTDIVRIKNKVVELHVEQIKKPLHPKIQFIQGDCLKVEIPKKNKKTMVILDCHHSAQHVYKELERYSEYVSIGQYLIVEDTDARGLAGGGPAAAVKRFLQQNSNFVIDINREQYGISSNIGGYLLRIF